MSIWDILVQYREGFLRGLLVTLRLCGVVWCVGLFLGTLIGIAGSQWRKTVGTFSRSLAFLLSGIPVLVLLFWLHYPLQSILNVVIDPFITSAMGLSLLNTFFVAETVRNVLIEFPDEYVASAKVCGLSSATIFARIKFPIVFRQMMPGLLMIQVNMLQMTLFASLIAVNEIFRVAQQINAQIYRPIEIYSALAIFFLVICLPLNGLAIWLRARFTRNISDK